MQIPPGCLGKITSRSGSPLYLYIDELDAEKKNTIVVNFAYFSSAMLIKKTERQKS
jgi:hypothetical protein